MTREITARKPIHPGEILRDELAVRGISAMVLADTIDLQPRVLFQVLEGNRCLSPDLALRLGRYFGMSSDFWMNLQRAYELDLARAQPSIVGVNR